MTESEIHGITSDIATIAGCREDLFVFAPRVLELACQPSTSLDLEHYFNQLLAPDAPRPSPHEADALRRFFTLQWSALEDEPLPSGPYGPYEIAIPTAALTRNIERYLAMVSNEAALQRIKASLDSEFWHHFDDSQHERMKRWFQSSRSPSTGSG
ncbi:MAG: hypothetical protein KGN02_13585 [bacterium]|nr:hypothetical protein [bacterium]